MSVLATYAAGAVAVTTAVTAVTVDQPPSTPPPLLSGALSFAVTFVGYVLLMLYLALGLRALARHPDERGRRWRTGRFTPAWARQGWPALLWQTGATALGGYLLLMVVVVCFYQGVSKVGGQFLASAVTGCALLIAVTMPLYLAATWLCEQRRIRRTRRAELLTDER
ncbi:DUF6256 family protein [Streptacidiphilus fuscans]|uniref:Uncharacterized protein n=1 Tax=Streptacidiphilus fuscans TaxID=2789292 RepID=A0A931FDI7_9ACTN|nr:DUF6256 family protein [Streptacidiphilus fuscans]MBF9069603.1 hypothetical protein [Streptacidiphilus fuscans]